MQVYVYVEIVDPLKNGKWSGILDIPNHSVLSEESFRKIEEAVYVALNKDITKPITDFHIVNIIKLETGE